MKIYRGLTPHKKGADTFRELLALWEREGLCEVIDHSVDSFCWVGDTGDILLCEYPRPDITGIPMFSNLILSGNSPLASDKYRPWTFWSRHPEALFTKRNLGIKDLESRKIESIFIGKVENGIQLQNRTAQDWSTSVEFFNMPISLGDSYSTNYRYTQEEYLKLVADSKFGLCLPGYGPKCNREIEYIGLGVVPIFTPGTDTTYHHPLEEGVHYLRANHPREVKAVIESCSDSLWEILVKNGQEWFEKSCSLHGSFNTTKEIIENERQENPDNGMRRSDR